MNSNEPLSIWDFNRPPDFTNEEGVQWWIDKTLTHHARGEGVGGVKLPDIVVFLVKEPNGRMTRLVTRGQEILHDDQSFEGVASYIDMMKASKHFDERENRHAR